MKRFLNGIVILVLVLILPCAFLIAAKNGIFSVHKIEVVSTKDDQPPQAYEDYFLKLKSKLSRFDGQNLWSIDLQSIADVASGESWVQTVEVYRRFPQTLRLEIKTKPSVAVFMSSQGDFHLIGSDGTLMPKIEETKAPKLPVIQDSRIVKNDNTKSKVAKLLSEVSREGELTLETVSDVSLGIKDEIWLTHLQTKSLIKLGDENVAIKSARVGKVLEYLDHNNLKGRVIDADFSKKVLVKLRNDR